MATESDRSTDPLGAALEDVVAVLAQAGIDYVLIGGLATGYRSRPRYTKDIDLILDVPLVALPSLLDRLRERGFEFDTRQFVEDFTRHHMAVLWRDGVRLDWLKPVLPAYRHVLERAAVEPGPTGSIRVATEGRASFHMSPTEFRELEYVARVPAGKTLWLMPYRAVPESADERAMVHGICAAAHGRQGGRCFFQRGQLHAQRGGL